MEAWHKEHEGYSGDGGRSDKAFVDMGGIAKWCKLTLDKIQKIRQFKSSPIKTEMKRRMHYGYYWSARPVFSNP